MVKKPNQIKQIINNYRSNLERSQIKPFKLVLYGSYLHGKPNKWSDIDLIVIAKDFGKRNPIERMEFLSQKAAQVDDSLEVLGFTEEEFKKEKDGIFGQIVEQGRMY